MKCRHVAFAVSAAAGAVLGTALFTSPAAYAVEPLFPPGTIGPIGDPTNVQDIDMSPLFEYKQSDLLYHVLDSGNLVGQFTNTSSFFESPFPVFPLLPFVLDTKDVISGSTYAGLADGATQGYDSFGVWGLTGPFVLMAHNYLDSPGVASEDLFQLAGFLSNHYLSDATGVSDVLTVFGQSFTLFDIPAAPAAGADFLDASWLTDLAGLLDLGPVA